MVAGTEASFICIGPDAPAPASWITGHQLGLKPPFAGPLVLLLQPSNPVFKHPPSLISVSCTVQERGHQISRLGGYKQWTGPVDYGRINTGTSAPHTLPESMTAKLNPPQVRYHRLVSKSQSHTLCVQSCVFKFRGVK